MIPAGSDSTGVLCAVNTVNKLMHYDEWHIFGLESGVEMMYLTQLDTAFVIRCIVVSLLAGAAYLAVGYCYFKKDDLS